MLKKRTIKNKESMNIINIAFATKDDEYVLFMLVVMESILLNISHKAILKFFILVPSDFSQRTITKIMTVKNKYPNVMISFVDVKDKFRNMEKTHDFIEYPTYYRLLLPEILPKQVEKCFYFDTDIIVNGDISDLYETELKEEYMAGVLAAGYQFDKEFHAKRINLPDINTYVNTGVILLNIKKLRENSMTNKFEELIKNNYQDQDQDILNVAGYGKVKIINLKYNLMTKYDKIWDKCIECGAYTEEEVGIALAEPVIIHYADRRKPWNNKNILFSGIWWDYAKKTPFYNEIKIYYNKHKESLLKKIFSIKKTESKIVVRFLFFKYTRKRKNNTKNSVEV